MPTGSAHSVIADGIIGGMRESGRCMAHRVSGRIVLADDPVAADFVCTRLMGLNPLRVNYLAQAAEFLGNGSPDDRGAARRNAANYHAAVEVLPDFAHLRLYSRTRNSEHPPYTDFSTTAWLFGGNRIFS